MYKNKYKILKKISPCWAAGDPGWTAVTKIPTSLPPVNRMPTLPAFWKLMNLGSGLKNNFYKIDFEIVFVCWCCGFVIILCHENKEYRAKFSIHHLNATNQITIRSNDMSQYYYFLKDSKNLRQFLKIYFAKLSLSKKTYIGPLFLSLASSLLEWRLVTP